MNVLSLLSALLASAFLIGSVYCLTRNRKSQLNVFSFMVLLSLMWWSFCNAFFFSAANEAEAWFWHHLAALGWTGFIAETTYYFIILTGLSAKMNRLWKQLLFYALPVVLLIHNLFADTTSLAQGIVKSGLGNQWAYQNSIENPWLWIYMLCLLAYFGFSFFLLLRWATKVRHRLKKNMAVGFVALDALTILLGFMTDVLSPLTNQALPAVANLCTAVFGAGYFFIIVRFDLFNVRRVVEDREIIDHSMEALMVVDELGEILKINGACEQMLSNSNEKLIGGMVRDYFESKSYDEKIFLPLQAADSVNGAELTLHLPAAKDKRLLISGSVIRDRKHEYMGTVLSFRDITQLSDLQEKYKTQSEQYRKLAFTDALTDLPNRRRTFEFLKECERSYKKNGTDFFILYMDLNDFKSVNDRYGHNNGDLFLKLVAKRLLSCIDEKLKFLGRLSGDEFLFVGISGDGKKTMQKYIEIVEKKFKSALILGDIHIETDISIGCALFSDFEDIDDMVNHSDEQMYHMKREKKTSFRRRGNGK